MAKYAMNRQTAFNGFWSHLWRGTKFVLNAVKNFSVVRVGFSRERMAFYRCTSMTACLVKTAWQSQRSGPDFNIFYFFFVKVVISSCELMLMCLFIAKNLSNTWKAQLWAFLYLGNIGISCYKLTKHFVRTVEFFFWLQRIG